MNKLWLVLVNEYRRHVFRKRFIFAILSMPLFVAFIILIGFLTVWLQYNKAPAGYVDNAGVLANAQQPPSKRNEIMPGIQFTSYIDDSSARSALDAGKIQAYFVISENYLSTGEVKMYSEAKTGENVVNDFEDFLVYNLLKGYPESILTRVTEGKNLVIRSMDGSREMGVDNFLNVATPVIAGVLFIIVVNVSGNYLLQAVVEEKENRTIEMLVTSLSPTQLMGGKVLGNLLVGLTQLVTWLLFAILSLMIAPKFLPIGDAPTIGLPYVLLMIGTLLPAFVMVAAAMGAIGATATEAREAQQIAGWFTLPMAIPFWFISAIMFNPNGALSIIMSLFPLTAPIALPLRAVFTPVPGWQIALVIGSLCLLAVFSIWLSGRIFRLGMLRYGKRVRLGEAFRRQVKA